MDGGGLAATILIAIGAMSASAWRLATARAAEHEPVIAVAPFHVNASDASASYVREGLLELLGSRIALADGKRGTDPSRVLRLARSTGFMSDATTPPTIADAVRLARSLSAEEIVSGSIEPAAAGAVAIAASLVDVHDSRVVASVRVSGPADSLIALVDKIVAGLVLPESGDRASSLPEPPSISPSALRDYLAGRAAYRLSDYNRALRAYGQALAEEPSFALAALGLAMSADKANSAEQHDRGVAIAWAQQASLPPSDRAFLRAFAGPRYPQPSSAAEILDAWREVVRVAPDRADAWYELGESLYNDGEIVGLRDAASRAGEAFSRALQLDPSFGPSRRMLALLYARRRDTASLRRLVATAPAADSSDALSVFVRWRVAEALGDSQDVRRLRSRLGDAPSGALRSIAMASQFDGISVGDGDRAIEILARRAVTDGERVDVALARHSRALNRGDRVTANAIAHDLESFPPGLHLDVIGGGWWEENLRERARELGIADAVTFHGHVPEDRKHQLLSRAWVHVMPSRKEGWGLAVIEAAQHGVPTVGYRSSRGLTDSVVDGVTGLLVDDAAQLTIAVTGCSTPPSCAAISARRRGCGRRSSPGRRPRLACTPCSRSRPSGRYVSGLIGAPDRGGRLRPGRRGSGRGRPGRRARCRLAAAPTRGARRPPRPGARPVRRRRGFARHPVQRQVLVGEHRLELRQGAPGVADRAGGVPLDEHPADPQAGQVVGGTAADQQRLDPFGAGPLAPDVRGLPGVGDEQPAGLRHVERQQPRSRVENRGVAAVREPAERARRQHRDVPGPTLEPRRDLRPRRRVVHGTQRPADAPRQVRQRDQHRGDPHRGRRRRISRGRRRGPLAVAEHPAAEPVQGAHTGRRGQRVAGDRERHPLLGVAQQPGAGHVHHRPLAGLQTPAGGGECGQRDRRRGRTPPAPRSPGSRDGATAPAPRRPPP